MKILKVALYKGSKSYFGKAIRFKQYYIDRLPKRFAQYSHAELVFEDGCFYGSSMVDGGVRMKKIRNEKRHWDFIEIKITDKNYKKVRDWCESKVGDGYNYLGIFFAQLLNTHWFLGREDYFCSHYATSGLQQAKMLCGVDGVFVSPGKLAELLKKDYNLKLAIS